MLILNHAAKVKDLQSFIPPIALPDVNRPPPGGPYSCALWSPHAWRRTGLRKNLPPDGGADAIRATKIAHLLAALPIQ